MAIEIKIKVDPNYIFAFLHGVIHPIILIGYAPNKIEFSALILALGLLTVLQYWLLRIKLKVLFGIVKGILAISTAGITFLYLLGYSHIVFAVSLITALTLSLFSYIMQEKFNSKERWWQMFSVLVIGQLLIFFIGFAINVYLF